jgi:hypothetical protein
MTNKIKIIRPKWLKFLLGIFSAWTSFLLTIALIFTIVFIFQEKIFDVEISGTPALILFIIALIISVFFAYRITKWQDKYLNKKSLRLNYIILVILILLSFLIIPLPMTYVIY